VTSPSGMSCETCRDLLIELVCDELVADTAAAVRAHALKCERCGPELEKLSRTLQASSSLGLLSPSPEVEHRIMQAAREAIAGRARGPAREATQAGSYGITAWFARLGSFAMSPQVAMASVLLLVVGIGLYALPFGRDAEPTALRATEDDGEGESNAEGPAASATATPLNEPQETRDEAKNQQAEHAASRASSAPTPSRGAAPKPSAPSSKGAPTRAGKVEADDLWGTAPAPSAEQPSGLRERKEARPVEAFPGAKAGSGGAAAEKPKKAPSKSATELADDFGPALGAQAAEGRAANTTAGQAPTQGQAAASARRDLSSKDGYAAAPPATPPPKSAPAPAPSQAAEAEASRESTSKSADKREQSAGPSALERGIAAIKRGDHAQGESLLKPIASGGSDSERSSAMLWLARSLRERGDCAGALNFYRPLTQPINAPRSVLEEAADCFSRTGNATAAERLRTRAALPATK
jgi:hypothetical protein